MNVLTAFSNSQFFVYNTENNEYVSLGKTKLVVEPSMIIKAVASYHMAVHSHEFVDYDSMLDTYNVWLRMEGNPTRANELALRLAEVARVNALS